MHGSVQQSLLPAVREHLFWLAVCIEGNGLLDGTAVYCSLGWV